MTALGFSIMTNKAAVGMEVHLCYRKGRRGRYHYAGSKTVGPGCTAFFPVPPGVYDIKAWIPGDGIYEGMVLQCRALIVPEIAPEILVPHQ